METSNSSDTSRREKYALRAGTYLGVIGVAATALIGVNRCDDTGEPRPQSTETTYIYVTPDENGYASGVSTPRPTALPSEVASPTPTYSEFPTPEVTGASVELMDVIDNGREKLEAPSRYAALAALDILENSKTTTFVNRYTTGSGEGQGAAYETRLANRDALQTNATRSAKKPWQEATVDVDHVEGNITFSANRYVPTFDKKGNLHRTFTVVKATFKYDKVPQNIKLDSLRTLVDSGAGELTRVGVGYNVDPDAADIKNNTVTSVGLVGENNLLEVNKLQLYISKTDADRGYDYSPSRYVSSVEAAKKVLDNVQRNLPKATNQIKK